MQLQSCILDLHTPVLTGPRQVGKITLLTKMAGKDRKTVSLDNLTIRKMAKQEPDVLIQRMKQVPPMTLPEIIYGRIFKGSMPRLYEKDAFSGAAHLKTTVGTEAVVCMPADVLPIDKKNWYIPAWLI